MGRWITFIVAALIVFSGFGGTLAGSSPPEQNRSAPTGGIVVKDGDWTVAAHESFRNATIYLTGNLTIADSGTLELVNTTLAMNVSRNGEYRISAYGDVLMDDLDGDPATTADASRITSNHTTARYAFTAFSSSSLSLQNGEVSRCGYDGSNPGLNVFTAAAAVEGMRFSGCYYGITLRNSGARVLDSEFSGCSQGVYCYFSSPTLDGLAVTGCYNRGIYLYYSNPAVKNCVLSANGVGIQFQNSQSDVLGCTVQASTVAGCSMMYSSPLIADSALSNAVDLQATMSSFPRLLNTTFNESRVSIARGLWASVGQRASVLALDGSGAPLPGLSVAVLDSEGNPASSGVTGLSGRADGLAYRQRFLTSAGPIEMGWHAVIAFGKQDLNVTYGENVTALSPGSACEVRAYANPPGVEVWDAGIVINEQMSLVNTTVICLGDAAVAYGASLDMEGGRLMVYASGTRTLACQGTMRLAGVKASAASAARTLTPSAFLFRAEAASSLEMYGCDARWLTELHIDSSQAVLSDTKVSHASSSCVKVDACGPVMQRVELEWAPAGLNLNSDWAVAENVTAGHTAEYCVYASQSRASISGLRVSDSPRGLYSYMGGMALSDMLSDGCDIAAFGLYASLSGRNITFAGAAEYGLYALESNVDFRGGAITGSGTGASAQTSVVWLDAFDISGNTVGVESAGCAPVILNSTLDNGLDVSVGRGAAASIVNTTFDEARTAVEPSGFIDSGHWTDVAVFGPDAAPVAGCNVSVLDSMDQVSASGVTGADGTARHLAFRERRLFWNRTEDYASHSLYAFKLAAPPVQGFNATALSQGSTARVDAGNGGMGWMEWVTIRSVEADEAYDNKTIISHGGVIVDYGATMNLEGCRFLFAGAPRTSLALEARSGGLYMNDTLALPITARLPLQPAWSWITYRAGAWGLMRDCVARGLIQVTTYTNNMAMDGCVLEGMAGAGLYAYNCAALVQGTRFERCAEGFWSDYGSPTVLNSSFIECAGRGLYADGGAPKVANCTSARSGYGFFFTGGSAAEVSGCAARNCLYGFVMDGASPAISGCLAEGCSYQGFRCVDSDAVLSGVQSTGNAAGLYCYGSWAEVRGSNISGNGQGVQAEMSGPYISNCTIDGNGIGISMVGDSAGVVRDAFSTGDAEESATFIGPGTRDHISVSLPSRAVVRGANLTAAGGPIGRDAVLEDPYVQYYPEMSGDWMVWQDYRGGNWDIYAYDLSMDSDANGVPNYLETPQLGDDPALLRITDEEAFQGEPDISGDTIVWTDYRYGGGDIFAYSLSNGTEWAVCLDPAAQSRPAVDGDRIVWQDQREGSYDIFLLNVSAGEEARLTGDPNMDMAPAINGQYVVWYSFYGSPPSSDYSDIILFDLKHWTLRNLNRDGPLQFNPDVYGDTVVWHDNRDGNWEIYKYDIPTETTSRLTYDPDVQSNFMPRIYEDTVVYYFHHRILDVWSVRMSNASTGAMTTLEYETEGDANPVAEGHRIAWVNRSGNMEDIHVLDLSLDGLPANVSADVNADGSAEFSHPGPFDGREYFNESLLADALNEHLGRMEGGSTLVPISVSAEGTGRVTLGPLLVTFDVPSYIVGTTVSNSSQAGALCAGSTPAFVNSTFEGNALDFWAMARANPRTLNTTFADSGVRFDDQWSNLTVQNFLHVRALNLTSDPLDVALEVRDDGDLAVAGRTGEDGELAWCAVTDRTLNGTGTHDNSTLVTVSMGTTRFPANPRSVDMSASHWELFFTDSVGPAASGMFPPSGWSSADASPEISVVVTDNLAVDAASVRLYVDGFMVFYTLAPVPGGYNVSYQHPFAFAEGSTVHCRIYARDSDGNYVEEWWNFTIVSAAVTWTVQLRAGWNLVSVPLIAADQAPGSVLSTISGKYDAVKWCNPLDAADPWKSYRPGGTANDLLAIGREMGFWIHATEDCALTVSGLAPASTSIALHAGWNLVGYPSQTENGAAMALWGTGADRVEAFDAASPYLISAIGPTEAMKPGNGYWVHVAADVVWIVEW